MWLFFRNQLFGKVSGKTSARITRSFPAIENFKRSRLYHRRLALDKNASATGRRDFAIGMENLKKSRGTYGTSNKSFSKPEMLNQDLEADGMHGRASQNPNTTIKIIINLLSKTFLSNLDYRVRTFKFPHIAIIQRL